MKKLLILAFALFCNQALAYTSDDFVLRSRGNGGKLVLEPKDAGGTARTVLTCDPAKQTCAMKGATDGLGANAGDVGEIKSAGVWGHSNYTVSSGVAVVVATVANVPAGSWHIDVNATVDVVSATNGIKQFEVRVHDGTSTVARAFGGVYLENGTRNAAVPISINKDVEISGTKTYTLYILTNIADTVGKVRIYGTDSNISGSLYAPGYFTMRRFR